MVQEFWHDLVTEKSYQALLDLKKSYDFVLIGGWAIFLYTHALKSKDIDIIVDTTGLSQLKTHFSIIKNDRLKKYEIKLDGFDIDIYLSHWSPLGLPSSFIFDHSILIEGLKVPTKEILLILKVLTYQERKGSLKGKKDAIDIFSLISKQTIDFQSIQQILKDHQINHFKTISTELLKSTIEIPELNLNQKKCADLKKIMLAQLKSIP